MRAPHALRHALGAAALVVVLAAHAAHAAPHLAAPASAPPATSQAAGSIELVRQTATVAQGGRFDVWVRLDGLPPDGRIQLVLHGRVRSRSELAESMEGNALRSQVYNVVTTIAELPAAPDGSRQLSVSLDPAAPGGLSLRTAGVYPVEIVAQDANGQTIDSLITHLLLQPGADDESPPLAVAVVAELGAAPALRPDGTLELARTEVEGLSELAAALADQPDVPVSLAVTPETLDALAASDDLADAEVLDLLRAAAADRTVLAQPYVEVSPDALVDAGLEGELGHQLARGEAVLASVLGAEPVRSTWLARDDLADDGLAALVRAGVRHLVVDPDQVTPLRSGLLSLSLAQPFLLDWDGDVEVDAMALDPLVLERLDTSATPGLEVSRLLAELALLWFEQPGIARGVVVPVDDSVRREVLEGLLGGLGAGGMFEAVGLPELFAAASPLRQPGGGVVDRELVPDDARALGRSLARDLVATRIRLGSFASLLGPDSPRTEPVAAQLLLATAAALDDDERRAHLDSARAQIEAVVDAVSAPERASITLTAREGTVPLTLHNSSGLPLQVVVHLRSQKLEFPDGDAIPVTLDEPTIRLDVTVRARASGAIPLEVAVTTPDGAVLLAMTDYSVQSTAVSGVGIVLSAGAAFFLLAWWARHWHRTRRSRKLVAVGAHPAHAARATAAESSTAGSSPQ